ncbi:MAG: ABC transporter permease [Anaerolineae bacterium]
MQGYILRRVLQAIPLVLGITILVFALVHAAPGSPLAQFEFNPNIKPEDIARIRANLGLDRPLYEQYLRWVWGMARGDFGISMITGRPVIERIGERIGNTLILSAAALLIALVISVPIGVYSAVRRGKLFDHTATILSTAGQAIPAFWLGLVCILLFAVEFKEWGLPSFPSGGIISTGKAFNFGDMLWHLVLPATVLAIGFIAAWSRYIRSSMLEAMGQDYVRTAQAKGLADYKVIFGHALRNGLIPFVTLIGLALPLLFSGALIIEVIFSWPGIGRLAYDAATERDYTTIMGLVTITAVIVIIGNLVADIAYGILDPRIRYD